MKIRLGYACISLTLDNITSSKIMTYSYYQKSDNTAALEKLDIITKLNLDNLLLTLKYNLKNNIHFFRLTSHLIPLLTHPLVSIDLKRYQHKLKEIGQFIKDNNLRIDMHPDQYCVINSINPKVINDSLRLLTSYEAIYNTLGYDGLLILHVGSSVNGKEESIERFINTFNKLPSSIKRKIVLENDDKIYNTLDVLNLCEQLNIPMVLDYHHHICNCVGDIDIYLERILNTWKNSDFKPKMHFSSSKNKKEFRSHNDYIEVSSFINFLNILKNHNTDIDIMIEAKMKDIALFKLTRELKLYTDYKFIDETSFIVEDKK